MAGIGQFGAEEADPAGCPGKRESGSPKGNSEVVAEQQT